MAQIFDRQRQSRIKIAVRGFLRNENAVLILVLVALIAGMGIITGGKSVARANFLNVLIQSSTRGIAAIAQAFVLLSRGIDISIGAVGLTAAMLGTSVMTTDMTLNVINQAMPVPVGLLVMIMVGAGWGVINGSLVSRSGIPALIVTLGMWQITYGVAFQICRGYVIFELPRELAFYGQGTIAGIPVPIIIFIGVAVVAYFVLTHTTYGRSVYAVGGNPVAAWLSGINVRNILFSVYIISGVIAGLSAVVATGRSVVASMTTLKGLEIDSIAAATVGGVSLAGGRGNLIGVVIGALIIGVVNNAMSILGATPATQGIVTGVIIISAVGADFARRRT